MLKVIVFVLSILMFNVIIDNSVNAELTASLWTPDQILLKEKYFGLITIDSDTNSESTFEIITDNEEVIKIKTEKVTIPPDRHHGLIEFETIGTGHAKVYAIFQDTLLTENIQVVESAESPTTLDLILPSDLVNVLVDDNKHTGYVFLLNDFENPVIAKEPITVILTSNGEVTLPTKSVTIESGNHYAKFQFRTSGEGSISASASNLIPDEEDISLNDPDEIELKIAIAPDPVPTSSSAEIYFWLERDGKPYIPSHDVKVTISIANSANLSFDSALKGAIVLSPDTIDRRTSDPNAREIITRTESELSRNSVKDFTIKTGTHYGKLTAYSTFDSAGSIKISGLAQSINQKPDDEIIRVSKIITTSTQSSNSDVAASTKIFAYPNPAYNQVEIIISSMSDNGPVIEKKDEQFTVFTSNKLQIVNTSQLFIQRDSNYAIVKANVVDSGSSKIFAERNESKNDEIEIKISNKYVKNPELNIIPLPVIFNMEQDLFLVTSSQEHITTNADDDKSNLVSITSRPAFIFETTQESESVLTIKGKISELLEDDPEIHVSSNAFTTLDSINVYNPDRKKLESLHPSTVYPRELFPIINHINDLDNNPVRKSILKVSSIANMGQTDSLFYFNDTGTHDIIFYDKNSVPIKSSIIVKGNVLPKSQTLDIVPVSTFTYDIQVIGGEGTGTYNEEEEVTISAPAIKDDMVLIKKKFVGWENLPYKEHIVTFEADDDVITKPLYEDDYSILFILLSVIVSMVVIMVIKKKRPKKIKKQTKEEDDLMELLGE